MAAHLDLQADLFALSSKSLKWNKKMTSGVLLVQTNKASSLSMIMMPALLTGCSSTSVKVGSVAETVDTRVAPTGPIVLANFTANAFSADVVTEVCVLRGESDDIRGYHYHTAAAGENMFTSCFRGETGSLLRTAQP